MTTLTEFKEIETPLLKFLRYFRDEKATGTLAYDELQHHIAEYTALIAVAEGMAKSLSALLDFEHPRFEDHYQTLTAYEAWKNNIEGEK